MISLGMIISISFGNLPSQKLYLSLSKPVCTLRIPRNDSVNFFVNDLLRPVLGIYQPCGLKYMF